MASQTTGKNNGIAQHIPLLAVLMVGLFLAILNQTLLNVAIPHLTTEFGVSTSTIQWLLTGYMLVNGVLIPMSAFLIERFGVRLLFLIAMFCFTLGAFICGVAPSFSIMLTGRLIQAVGGGVLSPLVMTIILYIFPPEMRGKGMGIFGLAMMFAPAIGPTLSGWIVQNYDWHLLFTGMVPPGVIVLIVAFFMLRNIEEPKKVKFDAIGTFTSLVGVGALLYGLSEAGNDGWTDPVVLVNIIVGLILIIVFVVQQLKSENPMLDMRVFKYGIFSLSNIISVILTVSMYAGMFLLPIYLQSIRGYTPLEAGLLMLPGALIMLVMTFISGTLFDKIGPRPLAIIGMLITTVTTYEFTKLTMETSYDYILVLNMARYLGLSFLMMPIMTAGINQLPSQLNKHGTAMSNTLRQISGSMGISIITTIFTSRSTFHFAAMSDQMNTSNPSFMQSFQSLVNSIAQTAHLPISQAKTMAVSTLAGQAKIQSTVLGINDAFFWATIISAVGLFLSVFLRDVRKDAVVQKEKTKKLDTEILMLPAPNQASEA
ncbi:DHA2 family efflux MFS transporter permease subunit [Ectobacillus panaciterrae]|uniref:DHA2 family efflux MFS transporter permease subunit n=1 Tax=Ectobacillus panaciterrae TaxID=363872 RepID=UPI00040D0912|nr:DHA2 family efflux MFS transporter permease subunit [Ectobacillus panaciterrae]